MKNSELLLVEVLLKGTVWFVRVTVMVRGIISDLKAVCVSGDYGGS